MIKNISIVFVTAILLTACVETREEVETDTLTELSKEAVDVKKQYSAQHILMAVSQIAAPPYLIEEMKYADIAHLDQLVDELIAVKPNILDETLALVNNEESAEEIYRRINIWCQAYSTTTMVYQMDAPIFLEEALSEIPNTKHIIDNLAPPQDQSWNSLTAAQLRDLPISLSNYLSSCTEVDRMAFYQDFFNHIGDKMELKKSNN